MRTILVVGAMASLLLSAACSTAAVAQPAPPKMEAVLLDLSTCLDTADLTRHVAVPQVEPLGYPPRYDYRPARKVERRYNRARRYYKRLNRRDNRELQKQSHQKYQLQRRQIIQEEKQRQKEQHKRPKEAEQKPRRRG